MHMKSQSTAKHSITVHKQNTPSHLLIINSLMLFTSTNKLFIHICYFSIILFFTPLLHNKKDKIWTLGKMQNLKIISLWVTLNLNLFAKHLLGYANKNIVHPCIFPHIHNFRGLKWLSQKSSLYDPFNLELYSYIC